MPDDHHNESHPPYRAYGYVRTSHISIFEAVQVQQYIKVNGGKLLRTRALSLVAKARSVYSVREPYTGVVV